MFCVHTRFYFKQDILRIKTRGLKPTTHFLLDIYLVYKKYIKVYKIYIYIHIHVFIYI